MNCLSMFIDDFLIQIILIKRYFFSGKLQIHSFNQKININKNKHSVMNCPFTKENFNAQNIKNVMKHACTELYQLLQNITYNFKVNGINYNATQFYKVIVRIATPFELLSQYHLVDTEAEVSGLRKRNIADQPMSSMKSSRPIPNMPFPDSKKEEIQPIHDTAYPMRNKKFGRPRSQSKSANESFFPKKISQTPNFQPAQDTNGGMAKNKIDPEMEKLVYQWSMEHLKNGRKLQMSDICRYAKSVSKNKLFQASSGWCANFLKRHLDLRALVKTRVGFNDSESDAGVQNYISPYPVNPFPSKMPSKPSQQMGQFNSKQQRIYEKKASKGFPTQQNQFSNDNNSTLNNRFGNYEQGKRSMRYQLKNEQSYEEDDLFEEDDGDSQNDNKSEEKKQNDQVSNQGNESR